MTTVAPVVTDAVDITTAAAAVVVVVEKVSILL